MRVRPRKMLVRVESYLREEGDMSRMLARSRAGELGYLAREPWPKAEKPPPLPPCNHD
jgi:hypothetical protein